MVLRINPKFIVDEVDGEYRDYKAGGKSWIPVIDRRGVEYLLEREEFMNGKSWDNIFLNGRGCFVIQADVRLGPFTGSINKSTGRSHAIIYNTTFLRFL